MTSFALKDKESGLDLKDLLKTIKDLVTDKRSYIVNLLPEIVKTIILRNY